MRKLEKIATAKTPYLNLDPISGIMEMRGRCIPAEKDGFWETVMKWFYAYSSQPNKYTKMIFDFEYFNEISSKQILFILHKLYEIKEKKFDVKVEWIYTKENTEMREVGFDFSCVVDVPFELKEITSNLVEN